METNKQVRRPGEATEIDLKELFFVLLKHLWIIILVAVICATAAGIYTKTMVTPMYQSSSLMYILDKNTVVSLSDLQLGTQLTKDYAVLIKSRPVVEQVIENLDLNMGYQQFLGRLSVTNPTDTRYMSITFTDEDPEMAKKIVDEVAEVAKVQVKKIMNTQEPTIAEVGHVPESPSSPNTRKNVMMAGLLGAFVVAFIIVLLYLMDDTIKSGDDLQKYLGLSTLGLIPEEEPKKKKKRRKK